jgi:hypothetical protein
MARNKPKTTFAERMRAAQTDFATAVALDPGAHSDDVTAARRWLTTEHVAPDFTRLAPDELSTLAALWARALGEPPTPGRDLVTIRPTVREGDPCPACGRSPIDVDAAELAGMAYSAGSGAE